MATYISGRIKALVSFNDNKNQYRVSLCPINKTALPSYGCETVWVGEPGSGARSRHGKRISVDDPRAMMAAARAAVSFSESGIGDFADWGRNAVVMHPPKLKKRKAAKRR